MRKLTKFALGAGGLMAAFYIATVIQAIRQETAQDDEVADEEN